MAHLIHWFRRDLRVRDNAGLASACARAGADGSVAGIFVIDPKWWPAAAGKLGAHQAAFWMESLQELQESLRGRNVPLVVRKGDPVAEIVKLAREVGADAVTLNKEYEPAQREMDDRLDRAAARSGLKVLRFKDAAVFEETEILTQQGGVYSVFTPYKRAYVKKLAEAGVEASGLPRRVGAARIAATGELPTLANLGFAEVALELKPGERAGLAMSERFFAPGGGLWAYDKTRDLPALGLRGAGTSRLSAHLNAGTVSIRQVMGAVLAAGGGAAADVFLGELIWREFYRMILYHYPHTVSAPFQEKCAGISWADDPMPFDAWRAGRTGYPIVDAAMRQLAQTGFTHNRLRMIAAMFLTKDLDTHWVLGERYFMRTLMDYDQASNVGGWQWSASTGTDAAPYFRVMNPVLQSERFDPEGEFIRHFVPELARVPTKFVHAPWEMPTGVQREAGCVVGRDYPSPVVEHAVAKVRAIAKFRRR